MYILWTSKSGIGRWKSTEVKERRGSTDIFFFFKRIYRDGIKNVFHNIWMIFQMEKIKRRNGNF